MCKNSCVASPPERRLAAGIQRRCKLTTCLKLLHRLETIESCILSGKACHPSVSISPACVSSSVVLGQADDEERETIQAGQISLWRLCLYQWTDCIESEPPVTAACAAGQCWSDALDVNLLGSTTQASLMHLPARVMKAWAMIGGTIRRFEMPR